MKINLVTMSTGKYDYFLPKLVKSARNFLPQLSEIFILSDKQPDPTLCAKWLPWGTSVGRIPLSFVIKHSVSIRVNQVYFFVT